MSRFLTVDEVVANAMTFIKDATDANRLIMKQWVYLGMREIGPSLSDIETCSVLPTDLSIRKPDNFLHAKGLALYNSIGQELSFRYKGAGKRIHTGNTNDSVRPIDVSEDDHYFHLGTNGDAVATALIKYYGLPLTFDGQIKIPEHATLPLVMFIRFSMSLWNNTNRSEIDQNRTIWESERRKARGRQKMPSMLAGEAIAETWNSMILKINDVKNF